MMEVQECIYGTSQLLHILSLFPSPWPHHLNSQCDNHNLGVNPKTWETSIDGGWCNSAKISDMFSCNHGGDRTVHAFLEEGDGDVSVRNVSDRRRRSSWLGVFRSSCFSMEFSIVCSSLASSSSPSLTSNSLQVHFYSFCRTFHGFFFFKFIILLVVYDLWLDKYDINNIGTKLTIYINVFY